MPKKDKYYEDKEIKTDVGEEEYKISGKIEPLTPPNPVETHEKFHHEVDRWFCNICGDLGKYVDGKLRCQGCGTNE